MSSEYTTVRSHRLGAGRYLAWVVLVVAVGAGVQSAVAGTGKDRFVGVLGSLAVVAACVLLGLRPAVVELPTVLEVRNPLRTARLPWSRITEIEAVDVVRVSAGDLVVRCYALPRRDRRPITSGMASFFGGRTLPDNEPIRSAVTTGDVVEVLRRRAGALGAGSASAGLETSYGYTTWAVVVLVLGAVAGLACVVLVVAA